MSEVGTGRSRPWFVVAIRLLAVASSYLGSLALATYPAFLTFPSRVIGHIGDPLMYFFLMRWTRSSLLEGHSPFFCDGMHFPLGVPLGYFPPLHFQSLCYLLLTPLGVSDVLAYNVIWTVGVVGTGLSAFALAFWVTRSWAGSWLAGLAAMLSGPMMMHMYGHLDLIQLWGVPLFLIAWIRFVDAPGIGRLLAVVAAFLTVTACAPYYMIFVLFPAGWYLLWSVKQAGRGARLTWVRERAGWVAAMGAVSLPGVALLLAPHIWTAWHGLNVARPKQQFLWFGSPVWSFFVPSPLHTIGKSVGGPIFDRSGYASRIFEGSSYLGIVVLGLLAYAAIRRVRFPRSGYWWSALAMMAVLSFGAELRMGGATVNLPADWVWNLFPPFHLIRVPSRFNLFVAACAAVPVSAALAEILRKGRWRGLALCGILGGVVVADAANIPFPTSELRPLPDYYAAIKSRAKSPRPSLLEAPLYDGAEVPVSYAYQGFWQMLHGMRTTAGYSSHPNVPLDSAFIQPSPFWARNLTEPSVLDRPHDARVGVVEHADVLATAWLQARHFGVDYIILHHGAEDRQGLPLDFDRLRMLLAPYRVIDVESATVYDPDLLPEPSRPTLLPTEGWRTRHIHGAQRVTGVLKQARLLAFSPSSDRTFSIRIEGRSYLKPRVVRLREAGQVLAEWGVATGVNRVYESPPIRLARGVHELTIESDSDDRPRQGADGIDHDKTPFSLVVKSISTGTDAALATGKPQGDVQR